MILDRSLWTAYVGENKMGVPDWHEYRLPISVKLVLEYHRQVPLLLNERDEWELPGGKLEAGESPEDTVRREAAEELGLTVSIVDIIDSWVYEITPTRHVFIVSYGTSYAGDEEPVVSAEHKQMRLFGYDEVPGLRMPAPYRATIARWRDRPQGTMSPRS
jgi:8-oxo-dGTP pyrophosphatase MutT (NUDIX family)